MGGIPVLHKRFKKLNIKNLKKSFFIPYRLDGSESNEALVIALLPDVTNHFGSTGHRQRKDGIQILHFEGYILDTVAMAHQVESMFLVIRRVGGDEHKDDLVLTHGMLGEASLSGL